MSKRAIGRRILKGLGAVALFGAFAMSAFLAALWLEHRSETTLPEPTGDFAVGRAMYDWRSQTDNKRELVVWIWYPADRGQSGPVAEDYLPVSWRAAEVRVRGALISNFLTRDLSKVHGHSLRSPEVARQQPTYPVVILRAGASAEVTNYSTLAEDLASHGYVVVGFDAPYRTNTVVFPDGRVITRLEENNPETCLGRPDLERCADRLLGAWTSYMAFVLDRMEQLNNGDESGRFTGRLDMTRVGVFGHSFGGAATALFCHDDPRCKAGIDVDGAPHGSVVREAMHVPFLFLLSDHSNEPESESRPVMADIQSIFDRLPPESRLRITIRGANHFLFSDDGALLKSHIVMGALRRLGVLGMDGRRQLAVTTHCVHSFFDCYLKGPPGSRPQIASPHFPEIQVF